MSGIARFRGSPPVVSNIVDRVGWGHQSDPTHLDPIREISNSSRFDATRLLILLFGRRDPISGSDNREGEHRVDIHWTSEARVCVSNIACSSDHVRGLSPAKVSESFTKPHEDSIALGM